MFECFTTYVQALRSPLDKTGRMPLQMYIFFLYLCRPFLLTKKSYAMIQRIQSVFLLVAAIVSIILLFIPIGDIYTAEAQYTFTCFNVHLVPDGKVIMSTLYIALTLIVSACISIYAIFKYKDRMKQTRIVSLNMLVFLIAVMLMIWLFPDFIFPRKGLMQDGELFRFNYWIMIFVIPPVCMFLANRFIRKDERLVRSADRLR